MTAVESSKLFEKLKAFKCYADECIFFKYIFGESDLKNDENSFKAEFVHQIFGEEETIFGYKNLRVNYYLTPGLLDACISLAYKEKISPQRYEGIEADDVYDAFTKFGCSPGYTRNLDVFCSEKLAADREFKPFGVKVHEYQREMKSIENGSPNNSTYEIYKVDSSMPEYTSQKFLDYMDRIQTLLVFYIETSNFIDTEDPQWTFFIQYEKRKVSSSEVRYATMGFLSLYNYYAFPENIRSRVSQIMIWPQYQRHGHGAELVESAFRDACQNPRITDITAESPSPEFIKIRDFVTTKMCCNLKSFQDREQLKRGFTNEMAVEALKKYKIPKLQSRRCYEILRLAVTNANLPEEWRSFRLFIKKRFYMPFLRRSKYARNAGSVQNEEYNKEPMVSANARDVKIKNSLESRFVDSGVTTIGFGNRETKEESSVSSVTTIGFTRVLSNVSAAQASCSSNSKPAAKKTVSFGNVNMASTKNTSLNTSNSTTDNSSHDDDEDESDEEEEEESVNGDDADFKEQLNQANLFVSEEERKKYLEQQFQESVQDYTKILRRLENDNLLCF